MNYVGLLNKILLFQILLVEVAEFLCMVAKKFGRKLNSGLTFVYFFID